MPNRCTELVPACARLVQSSPSHSILTVERLRELGACSPGLTAFSELFPEGLDVSDWTVEKQIGVLMHPVLRRYWGWAVGKCLIPSHSMQGWDLREVDLRRADLSYADLRGVNGVGADLTKVNFRGAQLEGARFGVYKGYWGGATFPPDPDYWWRWA